MPRNDINPPDDSSPELSGLFGGKYSISEALKQLRLRLLDLTSRNRLLNFKPSTSKSLQVIEAIPDSVYGRLLDGKSCTFIPVPDPPKKEYLTVNGRLVKPEARDYAKKLDIDTNYELSPSQKGNSSQAAASTRLRVLHYPENLERQCRRIFREAQSAIEETGTNMLYLAVGFLEFYESDDSDKALNAPLIAIPVRLRRSSIDPETRLYKYDLSYTEEEITENLSLREKLSHDFGIQLPGLDEDESPEDYFKRINHAIARKNRWKVKRNITLALLSFAKAILVHDNDPKNWPIGKTGNRLTEHKIIRQIFEGNGNHDGNNFDDYPVDKHEDYHLELIYDADTSQHRALIDILESKNLVINGPPGTGKSQTITNLIAAAMVRGKKVLFVSEKLAALEVVKQRLENAGLGDFCLELHSHKTDKKRVVGELKRRWENRYPSPRLFGDKLEILEKRRKSLKRYADLINSVLCNEIDLSVFEVLWRAERHRQAVGEQVACLETVILEEAPHTRHSKLDDMLRLVNDLARHYQEIEAYGPEHPWFGFFPESLGPGDDLSIQNLLARLVERAKSLDKAIEALRAAAEEHVPADLKSLEFFLQSANGVPEPDSKVIPELLPRIFSNSAEDKGATSAEQYPYNLLPQNIFLSSSEQRGRLCRKLVEEFEQLCREAKSLEEAWVGKLLHPEEVSPATAESVQSELQALWKLRLAHRPLTELEELSASLRSIANGIEGSLSFFNELASVVGFSFDGTESSILNLHAISGIAHNAPRELLSYRCEGLKQPEAGDVLSRARADVETIQQQRKELDNIFWLDISLNEAELHRAIYILRHGDVWYRFLRSDWRWSCRYHKSLSRDRNARKAGKERLKELKYLADYLAALKQLQNNQEYAYTFGRLFKGISTELEKAERLVVWYEDGRKTLIRTGFNPQQYDFNSLDDFRISQLALRYLDCNVHYNSICDFSQRIKTLLDGIDGCQDVTNTMKPWNQRLEVVRRVVDTLEESLALLKRIGHDILSPESILQAVSARCGYVSNLEKIDGGEGAKALLGSHFAGRNTDFEGILGTIAWGERVARSGLPGATKDALLSARAMESSRALKVASSATWEAIQSIHSFTAEIGRHGSFDWEKWSSAVSSTSGSGTPEAIRMRAVRALESMDALLPWVQYCSAREGLLALGLKPFADYLETGEILPGKLEDALLYRFYASIAKSIFHTTRELERFSTTAHERIREEFNKIDKEIIAQRGKDCAARISRLAKLPNGLSSPKVGDKTEMALLEYLMAQQRPRVPIRQIIRRAGKSIQELKPCFMMGPLSVAQYLEQGAVEFDIIVMDEASQLRPEEALGAIARGNQLVVVGDPKQLPPTSFFEKMMIADDDEDEGSTLTTSESILDICIPLFPSRTLRWHYRSKHESLIAFSNHHFYDGQLIVFPSPYPKTNRLGLRYHYIRNGAYQNRQNIPEAIRVVDAVIEHIRNRPEESLGVATLNITQRDLIEDILEERLKDFEEGEKYKARWESEGWPLFVKNLENVQGDERDVIFISTTFGRMPSTEKLRQNFGPISRPTGWRRLNVLFTRARKNLHVFSSMQPEDIVIDTNTPQGTRALRNYLEYASKGILIGSELTDREPDSDFEVSVADVLRNRGYEVVPQLGVAGFFIDIAVRNPDRRGEFMAAIECDGASYHSGVSVRDRDRIRQEILEELGWKRKIWRIWSADWFRSPQNEIRRLFEFLEACKTASAKEYPLDVGEAEPGLEGAVEAQHVVPEQLALRTRPVDEDEQLFVEVGDTVTYCDVKELGKKMTVHITHGENNFAQGIVNEAAPLARVLLDSAEGEEVELGLPGKGARRFRVLKIERK